MNRKLRGGFASDEGMSILEVVLAAVILFFVLTAVLALVASTTEMGLSARQRTAVTNAISSRIEWMRSLDFEDLALYPEGQVQPSETIEIDGFTITIDVSIVDGVGETREVVLTATAEADGFAPVTHSQSVVIRDDSGIIAQIEPGEGPSVAFISPTPEEGAVIYADKVLSGGDLNIVARAACESDEDVISELTMTCQSIKLHDGTSSYSNPAVWNPGEQTFENPTFNWDTRWTDPETGAHVTEGYQTVRVTATDSTGAQGVADRRFYVDNYAPGQPGTPEADVETSTETQLRWEKAVEIDSGTSPVNAPMYLCQTKQVDTDGSTIAFDQERIDTVNVWNQVTEPFSRYDFQVASASYRFLLDRPFEELGRPFISRPELSAETTIWFSGSGNRRYQYVATDMDISAPTFPVSSITYDIYRSDSLDTLTSSLYKANVDPAEGLLDEYNAKVGTQGTLPAYYYAIKVTLRASVYEPSTTDEVVWSNIIGPVPTTAGTFTLGQIW